MKAWQIAAAGAALLIPAGCQTDPAIPVLERELRCREDEIYRLRATIDDLQCEIRSNAQPAAPKAPADGTNFAPRYKGAEGRSEAPEGEAPGEAPNVEMPSQPSSQVPDVLKRPAGARPLESPVPRPSLDGDAPGPGSEAPAFDRSQQQSSFDTGAARSTLRQASAVVPIRPSGDSGQVASISIDRQMAGGVAAAGGPGVDGLLVVVVPRDGRGRPLAAPADMSVAVFDPAERDAEGMAVLVGRWDFTAAETGSLMRRAGGRLAAHLTMVWPDGPPKHHKLHVFVRYVTADGRKVQTDAPIDVGPSKRPPSPRAAMPAPVERPADRNAGPQLLPNDAAPPARPVWSPNRQ
jgi:hypothetical protein